MRRILLAASAAGALALPLAQPAAADSKTTAAIVAGVAGVAIGAALSNHSHHSNHASSHKFSPQAGIECYDKQRACYHSDGGFSYNWTQRIYG